MQRKLRGTVWVHIDNINNKDGDVWVIQIPSKKKYFTLHELDIRIPMQARPVRKTQPRAYLRGKARKITLSMVGKRRLGVIE